MASLSSFDLHSPKAADRDKVFAVWADPDNYRLGAVLDEFLPHRRAGHQRRHPSAVHLMSMEGARIFESGPEYFKTLRQEGYYGRRLRPAAAEVGGLELPEDPPSGEGLRAWRDVIAPRRRNADPAAWASPSAPLQALQEEAVQRGVSRVLDLGGFPVDTPFEPGQPDHRQLVICDGTMSPAFSRVSLVEDDAGQDHLVNSRALTGPPRLQSLVHYVTKDGRKYSGINLVALLVDTPDGWLVVAVDRALGGENVTAVRLLEQVAALAPGLRGVLSDRVLAGWPSNSLLRHHGLVCYHLPVSRRETSDVVTEARLNAQELLAQRGINAGRDSAAVKEIALLGLEAAHDPSQLLPLGLSVYRNSRGRLVTIDSVSIPLDIVNHESPTAPAHQHLLYVDDDSLVEVQYVQGRPYKTGRATLVCSDVLPPGPNLSGHGLRTVWQLDCPQGPYEVSFLWAPAEEDCQSGRTAQPDRQRALERLSPVSRADENALHIRGFRSLVESYFSRHDASLARSGFATYLDLDQQLLDFLSFAQLTNAQTWHAARFGHAE